MSLPIDAVIPDLLNALQHHQRVVLSAAPGAGKTTRVPLALLDAGFMQGKILMLEPRRLAAMRAAHFMASLLGERVGETVGYRIRGESRISAATRIEVVTEGVLTRLLQADPELNGIGCVIFDEFHERSLQADVGLAFCLDVQTHWRDDLNILLMSATLDGLKLAEQLGNVPVISSEGRQFPVQTVYVGKPENGLEKAVAHTALKALREHAGDVLVFLPGQREIHRCADALAEAGVNAVVHKLFGESSLEAQQRALQPDVTQRKIILATAIAETSLTIDGVSIVIDAGLARVSRFDPRRGMSGLVTVAVSQATAEQRKGRAGRQAPGVCYRLWQESQHTALARFPVPEILQTDLASWALDVALWGGDPLQLFFLDTPPPAHVQQAQELLRQLGALDAQGRITDHGKKMAQLPVHPRYAHMLLYAKSEGFASQACAVAAMLEERDAVRGVHDDVDLYSRWQFFKQGGAGDRAARERVKQQHKRLCDLLQISATLANDEGEQLGLCVALAFPERVAKRRDGAGERWLMANGVGARLRLPSVLAKADILAVADVDGEGDEARIFLATDIDVDSLQMHLPEMLVTREQIGWSTKDDAALARQQLCFGAWVLTEKSLTLSEAQKQQAMCAGIRALGLSAIPWNNETRQWWQRVCFLQSQGLLSEAPDFSEQSLLAELEIWLAPYLSSCSRRAHWSTIPLLQALQSRLSYAQLQTIDQWAPSHYTVPTGSRLLIDYSVSPPVLAVRLQEMFGEQQTPRIAQQKVALMIHLLSPAQRPLAVTQDLNSFWRNAYADVRKDMRGQYPKHHWPENPLEAEPTRRSKAADDRDRKKAQN